MEGPIRSLGKLKKPCPRSTPLEQYVPAQPGYFILDLMAAHRPKTHESVLWVPIVGWRCRPTIAFAEPIGLLAVHSVRAIRMPNGQVTNGHTIFVSLLEWLREVNVAEAKSPPLAGRDDAHEKPPGPADPPGGRHLWPGP